MATLVAETFLWLLLIKLYSYIQVHLLVFIYIYIYIYIYAIWIMQEHETYKDNIQPYVLLQLLIMVYPY